MVAARRATEEGTTRLSAATTEETADAQDEVPPYQSTPFRAPQGNLTLIVEAADHAGNTTTRELAIEVDGEPHSKVWVGGGGCC